MSLPFDQATRKSSVIIALTVGVVASGCTPTLTLDGLAHREARYDLTSWPDLTYYCGSKQRHDYFFIEASGPATVPHHHLFRVPESDSTVTNRFPYTTDRQHWRVHHGWRSATAL